MYDVLVGDCRETLKSLPDNSVHCCVTSPPYFNLRDYEHEKQIGMEETLEEYVSNLVTVFREVKRVMRRDGTLWLNLGDSYAGGGNNFGASSINPKQASNKGCINKKGPMPNGLKRTDLIGVPWMVAFALRSDGWYLRQDIIWAKGTSGDIRHGSVMPESVTSRFTKAHEYVFLLSQEPKYFFDQDAVKEETSAASKERMKYKFGGKKNEHLAEINKTGVGRRTSIIGNRELDDLSNRRSVLVIGKTQFRGSHFAVMPTTLAEVCVLAGTSAAGCCANCGTPWIRTTLTDAQLTIHSKDKDLFKQSANSRDSHWKAGCNCNTKSRKPCVVLDPFGGAGTTAAVATKHGRHSILCEINESYVKDIMNQRLTGNTNS